MVERATPDALGDILKAAADPTRRQILTLLAQNGPTRVTEIATRFDISLNAVSKHIMVLEKAGLVARRTVWRAHYIEATLSPLAEVDRWFASLRSIWALRLEALEHALQTPIGMEDRHDENPPPAPGNRPFDHGQPDDSGASDAGL